MKERILRDTPPSAAERCSGSKGNVCSKPVKIIIDREKWLSVVKKKCEITEYLAYRGDFAKRSSDKLGNTVLRQSLIPPAVGHALGASRNGII